MAYSQVYFPSGNTVKGTDDWLTVSANGGEASSAEKSISVTTDTHTGRSERAFNLIIANESASTHTVAIQQEGAGLKCSIDSYTYTVNGKESGKQAFVKSGLYFVATVPAEATDVTFYGSSNGLTLTYGLTGNGTKIIKGDVQMAYSDGTTTHGSYTASKIAFEKSAIDESYSQYYINDIEQRNGVDVITDQGSDMGKSKAFDTCLNLTFASTNYCPLKEVASIMLTAMSDTGEAAATPLFQINRNGSDVIFTVTPDTMAFTAAGGTDTMEILSTENWTITGQESTI